MAMIRELDLRSLSIQKVLGSAERSWGSRDYVFEKKGGSYVPKTMSELARDTKRLAKYLLARGLRGKQIAILSHSSYEFMVADLAVMGYVGVSVTMNDTWSIRDLRRAMSFLEVELFFFDVAHEGIVLELKGEYPLLEFVRMDTIADLIAGLNGEQDFAEVDTKEASKIIFSSGTTALPKAALLSQRNMFSGVNALLRRTNIADSDVIYNFMPLCHTFGGVYNFLYSLILGFQVYLCSEFEKIPEELKEVRPTIFCVVPLVLERMYAMIDSRSISKAKKAMRVSNILLLFGINLRKKLFRELHEAFGGELRYLFCGGAKLDRNIKKFFRDAGINLLEAYALTETASSLALEYSKSSDLDCVGTVYEEFEVRIDEPDEAGVGEILVRGDNVCLGYYKNEEANRMAFGSEGYFRTGDLGRVDKEGKLFWEARKHRMILLSNGINIYPETIEQALVERCDGAVGGVGGVEHVWSAGGIEHIKVYADKQRIVAAFSVASGTERYIIEKLVAEYNNECSEYWEIDDIEVKENGKTRLK